VSSSHCRLVRRECSPRANDAAARYANADALADDVWRYLDQQPVSAYRENLAERAGRWLTRHRALVTLMAAYIVMRVIVRFALNRRRDDLFGGHLIKICKDAKKVTESGINTRWRRPSGLRMIVTNERRALAPEERSLSKASKDTATRLR